MILTCNLMYSWMKPNKKRMNKQANVTYVWIYENAVINEWCKQKPGIRSPLFRTSSLTPQSFPFKENLSWVQGVRLGSAVRRLSLYLLEKLQACIFEIHSVFHKSRHMIFREGHQHEKVGDALRKIWIKRLKEINLNVAWALFDPERKNLIRNKFNYRRLLRKRAHVSRSDSRDPRKSSIKTEQRAFFRY